MNPLLLAIREISHRWKSSLLVVLIVAAITAALSWLAINSSGFQKEVGRNARDIGSNVVILSSSADQFDYHNDGGYTETTMPELVVQQLVEYKASLNHLIPMLERKAEIKNGDQLVDARIVGISASIPVPGRPKSPMQKAVPKDKVQLGSMLASNLGIDRDEIATISINDKTFEVDRINRDNGTWQDSAVFMDLRAAQSLFDLRDRISRIEAIECTDEQCELTGLKSDVVLANELARVTDQALLLRRNKIADARSKIRIVSQENLKLLQNVLWILLAIVIIVQSGLNTFQRKAEMGVFHATGYSVSSIIGLFVIRSIILTIFGSVIGVFAGAWTALLQSSSLFAATGNKMSINWNTSLIIVVVATILAVLASSFPAILAALKNPAELIGREG